MYSAANIFTAWPVGQESYYVVAFFEVPYLLLFCLVLVFLLLVVWLKNRNLNRNIKELLLKIKNEQYEGKLLMAQLHPHFVYNTFNAIQNLILQKKNTLAHTYLGKLANFQRKTMQAFYKDKHSLMEELELAHLYIELENLRLSNRIEFTDSVFEQTGLLMHSVPTVLLRPFLERAIAFGLTPLQDRTPVLRLSIILLENRLKITIEDNGIGRALAKEIRDKKKKQHELLGLEASVDFEELKPSFGSSVNYHITDLFDENNRALGTRVEIYVDLANKNEKSRSKNAVFS